MRSACGMPGPASSTRSTTWAPSGCPRGADRHAPSGCRELDRVREQVGDHAAQRGGVAAQLGQLRGHVLGDGEAALLEHEAQIGEDVVDDARERDGLEHVGAAAGLDAGEVEHLGDQAREPAALLVDQRSVALHLRGIGDDAVREVLAGGADGGERGVQLVGDARDELDLLACQIAGALRADGEHDRGGPEQGEDAEADRQVAPADGGHRLLERAPAVAHDQQPRRVVSLARRGRAPAPARRGTASPGRAAVGRPAEELVRVLSAGIPAAAAPARPAGVRPRRPAGRSSRAASGPFAARRSPRTRSRASGRSAARRAAAGACWPGTSASSSTRTRPLDAERAPALAGRRLVEPVDDGEQQRERRVDDLAGSDPSPGGAPVGALVSPVGEQASAQARPAVGVHDALLGSRSRHGRRPRSSPRPPGRTREQRHLRDEGRLVAASTMPTGARAAARGDRARVRARGAACSITWPSSRSSPVGEASRRAIELRLAPLGLGASDLADPAVLERPEQAEQQGEERERDPEPVLPGPAHVASVAADAGQVRALPAVIYIAYSELSRA